MPLYVIDKIEVDISRKCVILDTNVLVAAFLPNEQEYENAYFYLYEMLPDENSQIFIPIPVLLETWGMIVGSRKNWVQGISFLNWVQTTDNIFLLPETSLRYSSVVDVVRQMKVDAVDAFILNLADEISNQCGLIPPITIATLDTGDFLRLLKYKDFKFRLFDLRNFELI